MRFLYDENRKNNNCFVNLKGFLKKCNAQMTWAEMQMIVNHFESKGYIRRPDNQHEDSDYAKITLEGVEHIEETNQNKGTSTQYDPADKLNSEEQKVFSSKIDELLESLKRIELGQQVIYDDLSEEISQLKDLVGVLGKKDMKQLLLGKLVDAGLGSIAGEVLKAVTDSFSKGNLLN